MNRYGFTNGHAKTRTTILLTLDLLTLTLNLTLLAVTLTVTLTFGIVYCHYCALEFGTAARSFATRFTYKTAVMMQMAMVLDC